MPVIDDVRQIIANTLKIPVEQLAPDTRLDDIGAASLDIMEIVFELEEKYGITIPIGANEGSRLKRNGDQAGAEKLEFGTVAEVAAAVKALVDAKSAS